MDIEQIFAARVLNAGRSASVAVAHGVRQTTADYIEAALSDLHACGRALGYEPSEIQRMASSHIEWVDGIVRTKPADSVIILRP